MKTKFNFKSQPATSREQSERLLALGLKKETADMHHYMWSEGYWDTQACPPRRDSPRYIPAWSLHRLLEMMNPGFHTGGHYIIFDDTTEFMDSKNIYDNLCDCFEWLIKEGYFNKEYLA